MTQAAARKLALALPEAALGKHMGTTDVRVRNKIFATFPDAGDMNLKCTRESLAALIRHAPQTFSSIWGGRWLHVTLSEIDEPSLRTVLIDAWTLAAPKTLVRAHAARLNPDA